MTEWRYCPNCGHPVHHTKCGVYGGTDHGKRYYCACEVTPNQPQLPFEKNCSAECADLHYTMTHAAYEASLQRLEDFTD